MLRSVPSWTALAAVAAAPVALAAEFPPADAAAARKLYVAKCAKCHAFYDPQAYSDPSWQNWFDSMARKSKLKPPQADLLSRYLDAYRAGQLPGKPQDRSPKLPTR
jgi:hypothetical protein